MYAYPGTCRTLAGSARLTKLAKSLFEGVCIYTYAMGSISTCTFFLDRDLTKNHSFIRLQLKPLLVASQPLGGDSCAADADAAYQMSKFLHTSIV